MRGLFRILLLLVTLMVAGCSAKQQPSSPDLATPGEPWQATRGAGEIAGEQTSASDANADKAKSRKSTLSTDGLAESMDFDDLDSAPSVFDGLDIDKNKDVQRYFDSFTKDHRPTFEGWLKRAQIYLPHIRERFLEEGLPEELIYLPFVESGFNPLALSRAGASGVWQFMPQTGMNYGLKVDKWVDERRDPYKSTEAAIQYLKRLYQIFEDWPLALAAYNAGEGTIGRALNKTGCSDYFSLCAKSADIKEETKLYVPQFLAFAKIVQNLEELGFTPIDWDIAQPSMVYLEAKAGTDLLDLSKSVGLEWKRFCEFNPIFRKQSAPPRAVQIALPAQHVAKAEEYLRRPVAPKAKVRTEFAMYRIKPGDSWWSVAKNHGVTVAALQKTNPKASMRIGSSLQIPGKAGISMASAPKDTQAWANRRANYIVRQGDSLWSIAREFKTNPDTLLKANGLKSGAILSIGQKMFIPDAGGTAARSAQAKIEVARQNLVSYQIRSGDTLWNIAQRFEVSPTDLRKWNQLAENEILQPGKKLKVFTR